MPTAAYISHCMIQVMKFGNHNQIAYIAEEVGGVVGAAPEEAQVELFDSLIDGCRESVEAGNLEPKVRFEIEYVNLPFYS